MAKLKKSELLIELTKLGISYSGDMVYNDLYKLYLSVKNSDGILNGAYSYTPSDGEELLIDRPSEPLKMVKS